MLKTDDIGMFHTKLLAAYHYPGNVNVILNLKVNLYIIPEPTAGRAVRGY
jgi:hypothetical protein